MDSSHLEKNLQAIVFETVWDSRARSQWTGTCKQSKDMDIAFFAGYGFEIALNGPTIQTSGYLKTV